MPDLKYLNKGLLALRASGTISDADITLLMFFADWACTHDQEAPVVCTEIIRDRTGMSASTIFRRLKALEESKYLMRTDSTLRPDELASPVNKYNIDWEAICQLRAPNAIKQIDRTFQDYEIQETTYRPTKYVANVVYPSPSSATAVVDMILYRSTQEIPFVVEHVKMQFPQQRREMFQLFAQSHSGLQISDREMDSVYIGVRDASLQEVLYIIGRMSSRKPPRPHPSYYTEMFRLLLADARRRVQRKPRERKHDDQPNPFRVEMEKATTFEKYLRDKGDIDGLYDELKRQATAVIEYKKLQQSAA